MGEAKEEFEVANFDKIICRALKSDFRRVHSGVFMINVIGSG
jgi:hypothetical protein